MDSDLPDSVLATQSLTDPLQNARSSPSVWANILTPTAQAVLLTSAALTGTGMACLPHSAEAQISFDDGISLLSSLDASSSAMGDFDGDGDIDLVVTGSYSYDATTKVYENTGQNQGSGTLDESTFESVEAGLSDVRDGSISVGDFDGDGDLDLLITGTDESYNLYATIYENTGQNGGSGTLDGNTFQEVGAGLTGVSESSSSIGDFDGDEDLDLLIIGEDDSGDTAKIYENTGQNQGSGTLGPDTFQEVGAGLTGVLNGSSSVGDFDGDGDLDLLITGVDDDGAEETTKIYDNTGQNQGSGTLGPDTFQEVGAGITGLGSSSNSVGDFDGDEDVDLLLIGRDENNNNITDVYENTSDGNLDENTFEAVGAGLTVIDYEPASSVADFDGDNDIDLLVTGSDENANDTATIYGNTGQNQGSGTLDGDTFENAGAGLTGTHGGSISVGDLDGDLDFDLLITGDETATIYDNTSNNPIPVELVGFDAQRDGRGALLSWQTASEQNNAGFEVQHMFGEPGSGTFESMGFVEGAGTTDQPQTYRFRTENLRIGTHRFRLKQVDADGSVEYSETIALEISIAETYRLKAPAPNPTSRGTQLRLAVEKAQAVEISVYDLMGREVSEAVDRTFPAQAEQTIRINTEGLPAGTYFIRVDGERFSTTERLTVVK